MSGKAPSRMVISTEKSMLYVVWCELFEFFACRLRRNMERVSKVEKVDVTYVLYSQYICIQN